MTSLWQRLPRPTWLISIIILTIAIGYALNWYANTGFLTLSVTSKHPIEIQVFWSRAEQRIFHEDESTTIRTNGRKQKHIIFLPSLGDIRNIRINPTAEADSTVRINYMSFFQDGYESVHYYRKRDFETLEVNGFPHIIDVDITSDGFEITSGTNDPQIYVPLRLVKEGSSTISNYLRIPFFLTLILVAYFYGRRLVPQYQYVTVALILIFGLIVSMAVISHHNAHPDEHAHAVAAAYYKYNAIPPKVCQPDVLDTYTRYGVSRLNGFELSYYIAGSMARFVDFIPIHDDYKFRLFNLMLFLWIVILAAKKETFRILTIPLLISPQLWYVFSYFNTEAFSLFVCLMVAYQLADESSLFRRSLTILKGHKLLWGLLFCAALLTLLFGVKKSFYVFPIFLVTWLVIALLNRHQCSEIKFALPKTSLVMVLAIVGFSGWIFTKQYVNDFRLKESIFECREEMAKPAYKPSAPLFETSPSLYWRAKGIPLSQMLEQGWGGAVFKSGFGVYGFLEYPSGEIYYDVMKTLAVLLLLYVTVSILVKSPWSTKLLLGSFYGAFIGLIMMTMWNSWTKDYQAQGRYYFPLVPMLGILIFVARRQINQNVLAAIVLLMFICSCYSFLYIGLTEVF